MQNVQAQAPTPLPPNPGLRRGTKEAIGTSSVVAVDPLGTRTEREALFDEELAALLADASMQEEREEPVVTLDGEPTSEDDENPASIRRTASTSKQDEKLAAVGTSEPARRRATFDPSTRMQAGKLKWEGRFSALPHALLVHETFAAVPGRALKLLLAMLSQYMGSNNGHLTATASRMKASGFNSKDSLAKSIQELIVFGLIVRTRGQQKRLPALYAVTWFPIDKAPAGQPYDRGIEPGDEALDLWRNVDPRKAKGMLVARKISTTSLHDAETLH